MSGASAPPCWRADASGLVVRVRLTPKSSRDEIAGPATHGDEGVLLARVRAAPEGGKANAALEKLLARWLGLPRTSVSLAGGGKSRLKSMRVRGDPAELAAAITKRLAASA